jgi:hypothetical protein
MADNILKVPASTQLRQVADEQLNGKLIPINEYKPNSFEYSATNKNAISDGDAKGKADVGSSIDIAERSKLIAVNPYKDSHVYPDSSVV